MMDFIILYLEGQADEHAKWLTTFCGHNTNDERPALTSHTRLDTNNQITKYNQISTSQTNVNYDYLSTSIVPRPRASLRLTNHPLVDQPVLHHRPEVSRASPAASGSSSEESAEEPD